MKKSQKSTLKNNTASFYSKSKRQSSTPKKSKTSATTVKPSLNGSMYVVSPTSTVNINPKHSSPFDCYVSHQTSFNRLICKQNSLKPSPERERETNRFDQEIREILNRSELAKSENMDMIKDFLMESNKLFYDHIKKENKKMKAKLKQQLYEYIQGIKTEIMENMKSVIKSEMTPKGIQEMKERIRELNVTIIEEKFKIEDIILKTSEEIRERNAQQLKRVDESILMFDEKLEEYSSLVGVDLFGSLSDRLSEVIQKYNENFSTVNCNIDAVSDIMREIMTVLKFVMTNRGKRKEKSLENDSPGNRTAKFTSLEI